MDTDAGELKLDLAMMACSMMLEEDLTAMELRQLSDGHDAIQDGVFPLNVRVGGVTSFAYFRKGSKKPAALMLLYLKPGAKQGHFFVAGNRVTQQVSDDLSALRAQALQHEKPLVLAACITKSIEAMRRYPIG